MMAITIRLVGEQEDRLFTGILMDNQIPYVVLKKRLEKITHIRPDFQEIQFRGENLPVVEYPIRDIKFGEELILKHCHLDFWHFYLLLCDSAKDIQNEEPERTQCAQRAIAHAQKLEDAGFFDAYIKFNRVWMDTIGQMLRFIDREKEKVFEQTATKFFTKMFPNSTISFKPKQGGSRAGIVATVTCKGEDTVYYMKTYHNAGTSNSMQILSPDLREMFAYRLLEHIGVGPVAFFPYFDESTYIHCIATKEVEEFIELDKLEDVNLQKKVAVEAFLLSLIFGLRDLHEGNIGITKDSLAIIDFYVPDTDNFIQRRIFYAFKHMNYKGGRGKPTEILYTIGEEERIEIAKDALPRWSRIRSVTSDIIGVETNELRENGIKLVVASYDDVENYLQDIKVNYDSICLAFQ